MLPYDTIGPLSLKPPWLYGKSFQEVLSKFETNDYGKTYHWRSQERINCRRLLFMFISRLPNQLLPSRSIRKLTDIWLRDTTRESKILRIQEILLGIPAPSFTLIIYMLDLFAICAKHSAFAIAEIYHPAFFGPPSQTTLKRNLKILKFLIDHAKDILGGSIAGRVIPERASEVVTMEEPMAENPYLKKYPPDNHVARELAERTTPVATSSTVSISAAAGEQEHSKNSHSAFQSSSPGSQCPASTSITDMANQSRKALIEQLLGEGVSEYQILKYTPFIEAYIEHDCEFTTPPHHIVANILTIGPLANRTNRVVFGIPIWISIHYASEQPSTYFDLGGSIHIKGAVPLVVVKCCQVLEKIG